MSRPTETRTLVVVDVPLLQLPCSVPRWGAVAFVDQPGLPICRPLEGPAEPNGVRIDLIDASGETIGCLGSI